MIASGASTTDSGLRTPDSGLETVGLFQPDGLLVLLHVDRMDFRSRATNLA